MTHMIFVTLFLAAISLAGCSTASPARPAVQAHLVAADELPTFRDDLQLKGLDLAVRRQLAVLRNEGDRSGIRIGRTRYRTDRLVDSLERFSSLLTDTRACLKGQEGKGREACYGTFHDQLRAQFLVYRLDSALLTGYYTPTLEVSTQRTGKYRYPIYRTPDSERARGYSRDAIDFAHALEGKGYVLYYAADRFDLYIAAIEGGARLVVHDNGRRYVRYLHYAADNGRAFRHLDDYMVRHGMLEPDQRSRWAQRAYLEAHPEAARSIYASCPGYVFYKVSTVPPTASSGALLTANRSLASDPTYFPVKGAIAYVVAPVPRAPAAGTPLESNPRNFRYRTLRQFFIDQDIGHFITGQARADLFFGDGPYAKFLANNFRVRGAIYFLISK